jgi:hypothetical protein
MGFQDIATWSTVKGHRYNSWDWKKTVADLEREIVLEKKEVLPSQLKGLLAYHLM